jgi:poly(A) polymerase
MKRVTAKWLKEPSLQEVFAIVAAAGGEARAVGGALRNTLLKEPVGDIDLATTLSPQKIVKAFRTAGHSVYPTGIDHGTVTLSINHHTYEITTLRKDVETDGRRAVVAFTDDWRVDALRRDFTMNALYCDTAGKIYDYTNGYEDILWNRITFVGAPPVRIKEDYLRILRFFRFLSVYKKLKPDKVGLAACVKLKKGLTTLSAERIAQEMFKLLDGENAVPVLKLMAKHGVLKNVFALNDEFRTISRLPRDAILRAFVLAKNPQGLRDAWRLSNEQSKRIVDLLEYGSPSPKLRENEQRRILYAMGVQAWCDSVYVAWAKSSAPLTDGTWKRMLSLPKRWTIPKFPVSGRDLMELGYLPGPDLGLRLKQLEEHWVAADFKPTKADLVERLKGEPNG